MSSYSQKEYVRKVQLYFSESLTLSIGSYCKIVNAKLIFSRLAMGRVEKQTNSEYRRVRSNPRSNISIVDFIAKTIVNREFFLLHFIAADRVDEKLHRNTTVRMGIRVIQRTSPPPVPANTLYTVPSHVSNLQERTMLQTTRIMDAENKIEEQPRKLFNPCPPGGSLTASFGKQISNGSKCSFSFSKKIQFCILVYFLFLFFFIFLIDVH